MAKISNFRVRWNELSNPVVNNYAESSRGAKSDFSESDWSIFECFTLLDNSMCRTYFAVKIFDVPDESIYLATN